MLESVGTAKEQRASPVCAHPLDVRPQRGKRLAVARARSGIAIGDDVYKRLVGAGDALDDMFDCFAGHACMGVVGRKGSHEHERCRLRLLRRLLPCFELRQLDFWCLCCGETRVGGNGVGEVTGDSTGNAQLLRCDGELGAAVAGG